MTHFYDVGAGRGETFDWYLLKGEYRASAVTCFECSPRHLAALCARAEAVRGSFQRITIVPAVVGVGSWAWVYEKVTPMSDGIYPGRRANRDTGVGLHLPVISLAAYLTTQTVPGDQVTIKLDVEGSEYDILDDLLVDTDAETRGRIARLIVEWHTGEGILDRREELTRRWAEHGLTLERWAL